MTGGFWAARIVGVWCAWRRRRGRYDRALLAARWWAWRQHPHPRELLQLARCRRDFGLPLPRRWRGPLQQALPQLSTSASRQCEALLAADHGPLQAEATAVRQRFAEWLAPLRSGAGLCVVGNGGALLGRGLGPQIDAHAAVLRFNRWQTGDANPAQVADLGRALQVWAVAPDLRAPVPPGLTWALVSGADPVAQAARWPQVQALHAAQVPVLTVPLPIWRTLVRELQAPPSAGLLTLAWLRALGGGWQGLSMAGVGRPVPAGRPQHVLPGHAAGARHNWLAEQRLVARWRAEGLRDLMDSAATVSPA